MPADQLAQIFEVLEGGAQVAAENVIQFPVDSAGAAAEGALAGEGTSTAVQLGNGVAAEVSQLTVVEGGASTATTSGLGILAMDVGAVGAAIAPALGLVAGVALYNLAPDFWTGVSNSLVAAGQTIGGKVRAFLNGDTKQLGLSEDTIEIFKNALLEAGLFDSTVEPNLPATYHYGDINTSISYINPPAISATTVLNRMASHAATLEDNYAKDNLLNRIEDLLSRSTNNTSIIGSIFSNNNNELYMYNIKFGTLTGGAVEYSKEHSSTQLSTVTSKYNGRWILDNRLFGMNDYYYGGWYGRLFLPLDGYTASIVHLDHPTYTGVLFSNIANKLGANDKQQEGATLPDTNPFPTKYPEWLPWSPPAGVPYPANLPNIYPIEVPDLKPDIDQAEAQNPDPDPEPAPWLQFALDNLPLPEPIIDPVPPPVPAPDPDPQPVPEPIPDIVEDDVDPDPPNPNPDPPTPPTPVIPVLPDVVPSNAMFTVYRPSLSQLNSFGGWLWNNSIIEQILKMWQNPLDGIIAFMKVYAEPTIGSTTNIQVGYLDSGVPAPVVTSQFTTVDCGSVQISETKHNATDYSPYTSLHLYLPFIGIVELDSDEFMNGTISILYHIDVYTGTCLAEVKCTRAADMPNATIIYTFSGNASQQLPITSATFGGMLSALVTAGVAIGTGGSGGAIVSAAKWGAVGHSLTHEMVHIGHSGALSANAGIMASRKPYVIISRKHGYDANGYNELYGYPTNKTVFLGNCSGFTRVKAGRLRSKASEKEKDEIMSLLREGVIL